MSEAFILFVILFIFGLIIGSFLNVVIWRVPRHESLIQPGSHCPKCDRPVGAYDNIPVLSWILLRGRCRHCSQSISVRYPLVELGTGLAFGVVGVWIGPSVLLIPMLWFVAAAIALFLIDIDVHRLPNTIVLSSWCFVAGGLVLTALVESSIDSLLRAILGSLALGGAYLGLALLVPAGMGMGDVKLAFLLGLVLGWFGWQELLVGFFAGFLFGAVWGVALMVGGRATRKSAIPFGPFMIIGAFVALAWGANIAGAYTQFLL